MPVPPEVAALALHPFRELFLSVGFDRIKGDGILVCTHPLPMATIIETSGLRPEGVERAVHDARTIVADHGASLLAWMIAPEDAAIGDELTRLGLVNDETPGFERVEHSMALLEPPTGTWPEGVEVTEVSTLEEMRAGEHVSDVAFEMPQEMRDAGEASLPHRFEQYSTPGNAARQFIAAIDGVVVGSAAAVRGPAGVNLFGGSVLPEARGKGVYRALTQARWKFAQDWGTPALTVQAGQMSRPILEVLGFSSIGDVLVFPDTVDRAADLP